MTFHPVPKASQIRKTKKTKTKPEYAEATERARDPEGYLRCEDCGRSLIDGQEYRHHETFRSHGGDSTAANIAILCLHCHGTRHGLRVQR